MKWASAIADGPRLDVAIDQCAAAVGRELGLDSPPSLAVVFVGAAYQAAFAEVPRRLSNLLPGAMVVGCSAGGVIGSGREVEGRPAVSLTAACLPNVCVRPFRATARTYPTPDDPPEAWARLVGAALKESVDFLLFMDPFTAAADALLSGLDYAFPRAAKVGGLASGGRAPGSHALFLGREAYRNGVSGVALSGDIKVDAVVAQGCRPIGEPVRVTACKEGVLVEVDGESPMAYLRRLYTRLSPRDQRLIGNSLLLGVAVDESGPTLGSARPGDFLVRNIAAADAEAGSLTVDDQLREGMLVQFHVRDALTSAEDLRQRLAGYLAAHGEAPKGALMFQCNGRGQHLYGRPNHDSDLFRQSVGSVPLGGFFCSGEIGPVGRSTFLHSYTSSIALFRKS